MKSFKQYTEQKDMENGFADLEGVDTVPSETLVNIAKIAAEDHREELLHCFEQLAKKNRRIRDELDSYKRDGGGQNVRSHTPKLKDDDNVVIPPSSDTGEGMETES